MEKGKSLFKKIYQENEGKKFHKQGESISVICVGRFFGIPLAKLITKIPFKIHPNIITILSFGFAILAGYYFFQNLLILGSILYLINFILDCTDGTLARLTGLSSTFGSKLDFYTDRIGIIILYFGLWWSQYYQNKNALLGIILISAHYAIMIFGEKYIKNKKYRTVFPRVNSYYSSFEEGFGTFFIAPLLGMVTILLPILILLQLISYVVLYIKNKKSV